MPEVPVTALDLRLQQRLENARVALDRGNADYTINICLELLEAVPGCLVIRKLLRAAQFRLCRDKNKQVAKGLNAVITIPSLIEGLLAIQKNPRKAMMAAEKVLSGDPTHIPALKLLSRAASALDFGETAVFAMAGVYERRKDDETAILLGNAYVQAGSSSEAMMLAESLIIRRPNDARVRELIKNASVIESINAGNWDADGVSYRGKLKDEATAISLEQSAKAVASKEMTERLVREMIEKVGNEPNNLNHYRQIIRGYESLGNFDLALEWIGKARKLPVGQNDAELLRQESALKMARLEETVSERRRSGGSKGELDALEVELISLRIKEAEFLVEKYPTEGSYRFDLGKLYFAENSVDAAIQQFQSSQKNRSLRNASLVFLGACFKQKELYDLAVQQFETAKSELSAMDEQKKEVIYELALCYESMSNGEAAGEEYKLIYAADIGFRDVAEKVNKLYSKP
jgi:tetratricopeptide (TPR) repeat protein